MSAGLNADWLAALHQRANQPPLRPRLPLFFAGALVGSLEEAFFNEIAFMPAWKGHSLLQKTEHGIVASDLNALALAMRDAALCGPWRGEALAVYALTDQAHEEGKPQQRIGTIERGAVRPLGIPTQAVHLVGWAEGGGMWVQQRALTKANDPGQWDTLMGGMVSAADTLPQALERETWEEAGLHTRQLPSLRHGGQVRIRRPSEDARGMGYMVERIDWFTATVPQGTTPLNQDGEVERFELLQRPELLERLHDNAFTLEASLILAAALGV